MTAQLSDFELSPELTAFRDKARAYAADNLAAHAADWDRDVTYPKDAVTKAGELGLLGITIKKDYGGSELGNLASCIMLEEINAVCPSTGVTISVHNSLFCSMLGKWGSEDQKQRYLPKLASGEWIGAYCLSEAGAGSDAAGLVCEAKLDGDHYVLNGPKLWITTGSVADAFVVFARTGEHRIKGISAFVVERSFEGVAIGKKERKLGLRGSPTVEVLHDNVRVPVANRIGDEGVGFKIALDTLDGGRLGIASQSLGISRTALEMVTTHLAAQLDAKGRPTSSQDDQWTMADMATDVDAARMLVWRAAALRDAGKPCGKEAAMAKLFASRLANRAARQAVSILGRDASSGVHAAERLVRDARITEIYEGVTDIQRLVIARAVIAS